MIKFRLFKIDVTLLPILIPAAWSVGELVNSNMKEVIVAIVLAYEFEQRLCLFAKPGSKGWYVYTLFTKFQ